MSRSAIAGVTSAVVLATLSGCGSSENDARVERCVDRLLSRADSRSQDDTGARDYARRTYCERFARRGWVYEDGALRIAAQKWLVEGGRCEAGGRWEPARAVPCDEVDHGARVDCALLHHVRRGEVRDYVDERRPEGPFACDDGTPLDELGVP